MLYIIFIFFIFSVGCSYADLIYKRILCVKNINHTINCSKNMAHLPILRSTKTSRVRPMI